jgi:hypothetical protein
MPLNLMWHAANMRLSLASKHFELTGIWIEESSLDKKRISSGNDISKREAEFADRLA